MVKRFFLLLTSIVSITFSYCQEHSVKLDTVGNYNGWGWQALFVDNDFVQLLILPEIGGRVLHYGFENDTFMAVNSSQINRSYDITTNQTGPWTSWGYGGYKAWPAPQSVWNWPPPPYLDWGSYEWSVEHASADSVIIYLKSPVESYRTPGLQQARRFKIYSNSTRVRVEQILKNISNSRIEWSVWEVTQAVVDHNGTHDYENISTYFPSGESDIKVLMGSKIPTAEVEDNVRRFNYAGSGWKIGTLLKEGWACFVDESDEQTYAKIFDIDPVSAQYPDQNSNFQIYVGGNYVEIEVLGPLTDIAQGDSIVYTENWYAANTRGAIRKANHCGAVRNRLSYNLNTMTLEGEYGIFNSGSLRTTFYDAADQEINTDEPVNVTAAEKFTLSKAISVPAGTEKIELLAYDTEDHLIGVLDSLLMSDISAAPQQMFNSSCAIYPTVVKKGNPLFFKISECVAEEFTIDIHALPDGKLAGKYFLNNKKGHFSVNTSNLAYGMYLITIRQDGMIFREKICVR
ncbi:MAG: hypothetical protein JXR41_04495 [Bacteroidales bacterium]|nr:hypothetical protein [Bacteroidales bacterium]MBN2762329.1 hypothetical protein [Bacteroidales bacterium]